MRWQGQERSKNIEDRRSMKGPAALGGGGLLIIVIGAIIAFLNGAQPQQIAQQVGQQLKEQQQAGQGAVGGKEALIAQQAELQAFSEVVLKYTEDVWNEQLPKGLRKEYREPILVFYDGNVTTEGCGSATSAVGPFYCPADFKLYLDLSFFDEMRTKFKAPGDFACAYVIAHEVGHHIQNLLGLSRAVQSQQARLSKVEGNQLSVRLELQADFLAGVWAHHAQRKMRILEEGDIGEAINAAQQIGDDTLQKAATGGRIVPDAFTHGTAKQRVFWFTKGLESGDLNDLSLPFELDYDQL